MVGKGSNTLGHRWVRSARYVRTLGIGLHLLVLVICCLLLLSAPAEAQNNPTDTPDAEGFIYVEVQPDDSLWAIAARSGLTIPELLALNDLDASVVLQPGDRLIVARVTPPATATSDIPTPTLPPPSPSATAVKPRTAVCIIAFDDLNRDGSLDQGEAARPNVAFTIYNEQEVVANYVTDGVSEPYCLEALPPGVYHVTRSKTQQETLTTEGDWALTLAEGSVLNLAFGSYEDSGLSQEPSPNPDEQLRTRLALTPEATPTTVVENNNPTRVSLLMVGLAVAGFVLLAGAAVLTFLFVKRGQEE